MNQTGVVGKTRCQDQGPTRTLLGVLLLLWLSPLSERPPAICGSWEKLVASGSLLLGAFLLTEEKSLVVSVSAQAVTGGGSQCFLRLPDTPLFLM